MKIFEILGNIGFDWRVAFANFVNFLIIFYLLKRYAFGPIGRILNERRNKIEEGIENARKAETDMIMAKEERARAVEKGKEQANEILASARTQEDTIIAVASEHAREEAGQILKKAHLRAEEEKKEMELEVLTHVADLVVEGVERVLREEINLDKGERIVKEMLARA